MNWRTYIVSDPSVLFGKPVIKGARISVEFVLEKLGQGISENELLKQYPHLTKEQIKACLQFASEYLKSEVVIPVSS